MSGTQASKEAENKSENKKTKSQTVVYALQSFSAVVGAFVGIFISAYFGSELWDRGFYFCAVIAIAWAVAFIWWRIQRDTSNTVDALKTTQSSCINCETKCNSCADELKRINDSKNHHNTQCLVTKKTIFVMKKPTDKDEYTCDVEIMHRIRNYSEQTLEKFTYKIDSDVEMDPCLCTFNSTIQQEGETKKKIDAKISRSKTEGEMIELGYSLRLDYSPDIMSDKTAELTIKHKSPSFNELFKTGKHESTGCEIKYKTHELELTIQLCGEISKEYNLSTSIGKPFNWNIFDASGNHLRSYEKHVSKTQQEPKLSDDKKTMIWKIQNPKLACKFELCFSLERIT